MKRPGPELGPFSIPSRLDHQAASTQLANMLGPYTMQDPKVSGLLVFHSRNSSLLFYHQESLTPVPQPGEACIEDFSFGGNYTVPTSKPLQHTNFVPGDRITIIINHAPISSKSGSEQRTIAISGTLRFPLGQIKAHYTSHILTTSSI